MPNGRSGGFLIETAALKRLVSTVSDTTAIGQVVGGSPNPRIWRADAAEVARVVEECPHEQVAVEEQDCQAYVIHLRNTPTVVWLVVHSESPLFVELRQQHAQWKIEHPNWTGWTGF